MCIECIASNVYMHRKHPNKIHRILSEHTSYVDVYTIYLLTSLWNRQLKKKNTYDIINKTTDSKIAGGKVVKNGNARKQELDSQRSTTMTASGANQPSTTLSRNNTFTSCDVSNKNIFIFTHSFDCLMPACEDR